MNISIGGIIGFLWGILIGVLIRDGNGFKAAIVLFVFVLVMCFMAWKIEE